MHLKRKVGPYFFKKLGKSVFRKKIQTFRMKINKLMTRNRIIGKADFIRNKK